MSSSLTSFSIQSVLSPWVSALKWYSLSGVDRVKLKPGSFISLGTPSTTLYLRSRVPTNISPFGNACWKDDISSCTGPVWDLWETELLWSSVQISSPVAPHSTSASSCPVWTTFFCKHHQAVALFCSASLPWWSLVSSADITTKINQPNPKRCMNIHCAQLQQNSPQFFLTMNSWKWAVQTSLSSVPGYAMRSLFSLAALMAVNQLTRSCNERYMNYQWP